KVSEDINIVKSELEAQLAGRKLTEVCIAAAGRVLKTAVGHGQYEFSENTLINQEHIHSIDLIGVEDAHDKILQELSENKEETKYYCVGYTVVKYFLNDFEILNLEGHKGTRIGADVLATFLPEEVVSSLYSAVELSGLTVCNLTLEPIAAINVAIPENYRLLNIALVDVGAGTSDICITKDGSIIGYGMIPSAGDELTEAIVKKYLVDFNTAEKLKTAGIRKKTVAYKDIMGISHKVSTEDISQTVEGVKREITAKIADKIIELNGGASVSAVFVVGGGGKLAGFTDYLAKALRLPSERVALRGQEVMTDINFLIDNIKKDSLYVTPIGICLNYFDQKNNFIFVNVNGSRVKLYNNDHLTIFDAAHAYGLSNDDIFPKRGADITFKINGKTRIVRGYMGETAQITQNGLTVGMNSRIEANDKIEIVVSTVGKAAELSLSSLPEYNGTLDFIVNDTKITCPKFAMVNGQPESQLYMIQDGDDVLMQPYYTLEQLFVFMDVTPKEMVFVNNKPADLEEKIYDNFVVSWSDLIREYNEDESQGEPKPEDKKSDEPKQSFSIHVTVNGFPYTFSGKNEYRFVDVFDYYKFDMSTMGGKSLVTNINGVHAEFIDLLKDGDAIELYWQN
ncbi:MAG: cell division FtsA domain-containing protein, partial [Wujia sp.]